MQFPVRKASKNKTYIKDLFIIYRIRFSSHLPYTIYIMATTIRTKFLESTLLLGNQINHSTPQIKLNYSTMIIFQFIENRLWGCLSSYTLKHRSTAHKITFSLVMPKSQAKIQFTYLPCTRPSQTAKFYPNKSNVIQQTSSHMFFSYGIFKFIVTICNRSLYFHILNENDTQCLFVVLCCLMYYFYAGIRIRFDYFPFLLLFFFAVECIHRVPLYMVHGFHAKLYRSKKKITTLLDHHRTTVISNQRETK